VEAHARAPSRADQMTQMTQGGEAGGPVSRKSERPVAFLPGTHFRRTPRWRGGS
jgi:hypothetical protein